MGNRLPPGDVGRDRLVPPVKVLHPTVTVLLASHLKPDWLPSALDSVLTQTRLDVQVIVCDSGEWISGGAVGVSGPMTSIQERYARHPLIDWVTLGEPPRLIDRACPYGYTWNRVLESGLARGRYLAIFTDDDLYAPTYVETMAGYLDRHPRERAVWCSLRRVHVDSPNGPAHGMFQIMAEQPRHPGQWLDQVDMLQVMFHRQVLAKIPAPWFSEDPTDEVCRHADGLFLERLAEVVGPVPNVAELLVTHRHTLQSTYN